MVKQQEQQQKNLIIFYIILFFRFILTLECLTMSVLCCKRVWPFFGKFKKVFGKNMEKIKENEIVWEMIQFS